MVEEFFHRDARLIAVDRREHHFLRFFPIPAEHLVEYRSCRKPAINPIPPLMRFEYLERALLGESAKIIHGDSFDSFAVFFELHLGGIFRKRGSGKRKGEKACEQQWCQV